MSKSECKLSTYRYVRHQASHPHCRIRWAAFAVEWTASAFINCRRSATRIAERDTKIAAAGQRRARALFVLCFREWACVCMYVGVKFINKSRGVKVKCVASNITKHKWIPHNINERSQSDAIKWKISKIKKKSKSGLFLLNCLSIESDAPPPSLNWKGRCGSIKPKPETETERKRTKTTTRPWAHN